MPERARDHRGLVGEDVAEQVLGEQHVEAARLAHEQHRARVDELVRELDVVVVLRHLVHDLDPELRDLEHVRLVHVRHVPAASARGLEGDARDALDLDLVVDQRVARLAPARRRARGRAARRSRARP